MIYYFYLTVYFRKQLVQTNNYLLRKALFFINS